jgi:hypothetical protein
MPANHCMPAFDTCGCGNAFELHPTLTCRVIEAWRRLWVL